MQGYADRMVSLAPLPRAGKVRTIHEAIKRQIVIGAFPAGMPLIETQLARGFGCSQASIREALLKLQEDGLVHRAGYRGSRVADTTLDEARELLVLRLHIETQAMGRALPAMDQDARAGLLAIIEDMEEAARAGDTYGVTEYDRAFHLAIFERAALPALKPILERCMLHAHRFALANPDRRRTLIDSASRHRVIVDAVATGEAVAAQAAIRDHINTVIEGMPPLAGGTELRS